MDDLARLEQETWLSVEEAVEALRALGYEGTTRWGLQRRVHRPDPPPYRIDKSRQLRFRWDLLQEWAAQQTLSRIELDTTTLGRWLLTHRYTARSFAQRLEIGVQQVRDLLGHRNAASRRVVNIDVVKLIALETGISEGVLFEEAVRGD